MNTGTKELKSILEELDELRLPHMAAELETLYKQPAFVNISNGFIPVGIYTIVDEKDGWGLLKAYSEKQNGWVCLNYVEKV